MARGADPEVIVDFQFEEGLLYVAVQNTSGRPAYDVSTKFDKPFRGVGGTKDMNELRLFRRITFLAPRKEIRAFVDVSASYFARREPTRLEAQVSWKTADGGRHTHSIRHDLGIYRDLGFVRKEAPLDGRPA